MAFIHGFRVFALGMCSKTKAPVLRGSAGMHLHASIQEEAQCRGISTAMWMTEAALDRMRARHAGGPRVPHDGPSPDWDCTCGAYGYRTLKDAWSGDGAIYAHVTCLGRTILHTAGWRTSQYSVDYFLEPEQEIRPAVIGFGWDYDRSQKEALEELAPGLGVPILEKNDLQGCPDCLVVNLWRRSSEITDQMRKDWYGEGYHG